MSEISFSQLHEKLVSTLAPRHAIAVGVVFFLTVLLASLLAVYFLRQDSRRVAELEVANLSILLAEHALDVAEATDHVLSDIAAELGKQPPRVPIEATLALHDYLKYQLQRLRHVRAFGIDNAMGQFIASTLGFPAPQMYSGDQDYFQFHRDKQVGDVTLVDHPVKGRVSGVWTIRASKRISGLDACTRFFTLW